MNRIFRVFMAVVVEHAWLIFLVLAIAVFSATALAAEGDGHGHDLDQEKKQEQEHGENDGHAHETGADHEEESIDSVELKDEAIALADIRSHRLEPQALSQEISAPGEVKFNAYQAAEVSTRVPAQILERHVRLGDDVQEGQALVTLHSLQVAEAQSAVQVAAAEWQRVQRLGEELVGARRYLEARNGWQQARAQLAAYDLSRVEIDRLSTPDSAIELGRFTLTAPRTGTVMRDEFLVGDYLEAGADLMLIADERVTWVEANLRPEQAGKVKVGDAARVQSHSQWFTGTVTQKHHLIDEATRTIAVRIELLTEPHEHDNEDKHEDALHAGEFVDVRIPVGESAPRLAVPEAALQRDTDGDWFVFIVEEPGHYKRVAVTPGDSVAGQRVIEGVAPGTEIVVDGAFFLASELAKGGFEIHNH